jgi:CubicO group peptidase (beta-lactamase class C family)
MRESIQTHSLNGSTGKIAASSILVNRRGALLKYSPSMFVLALALLLVPACASNSDPIPAPASVSDKESGLAGLVASIEEVLPSSPASAAMVFVDDSGATYAFAGDPGTDRSTGFEFASVTKVMTAVLIADLAGEGLIDLDASFSSYFTGDDLSRAWDTVTARSLLTHSAGMPAFPPNLNPALLWLSGRAGDPFGVTPAIGLVRASGAPGPAAQNAGAIPITAMRSWATLRNCRPVRATGFSWKNGSSLPPG